MYVPEHFSEKNINEIYESFIEENLDFKHFDNAYKFLIYNMELRDRKSPKDS